MGWFARFFHARAPNTVYATSISNYLAFFEEMFKEAKQERTQDMK
jgi:hypothetical protein